MEEKNKSLQNMEIALQRKAGCFGIQHVHKVSDQSDHKETQKSNSNLYSKENSSKKVSV